MILALIGNPNSGKTTLFNQLTGSNQHVGNFPGVTVDKKSGTIRDHDDIEVVDLPGIYSMSPYSHEEIVTRDFLIKEKPQAIINILDATNIERNLYLSLQLMELNIPMVIAMNMMDEMRNNGGTIRIRQIREELGVPIVPISASRNEGISELIDTVIDVAMKGTKPLRMDLCSGAVHRAIHSISHQIEDHALRLGIPPRFAATKMVEGDELMVKMLQLSSNELDLIEHLIYEMETEMQIDRYVALADMRYQFIESVVKKCVVKGHRSKERERSIQIDKWLTHRYLGIPIFIVIMLLIFFLSFELIGSVLSDWMGIGIDAIIQMMSEALLDYGINPVVYSMVIDGAMSGIGSVLTFLPIIVTLFFFLSILEDSGYMARVAFVMDKPLRKVGLSGRSFVPLLIGFGCSVPAIMATRTLSSERDRKMTILLTPFMSCSAKLPIYAVFTYAFFRESATFVMMVLYLLGMATGVLTGLILNGLQKKSNPVPFVMELPNYRLPSATSVWRLVWDKAKDFLVKAFTVIFLASMLIWFLQTFDTRLNVVANSEDSLLALIGQFFAPLFKPLGFSDWRVSTALMTGFSAKEAVVSTLAVLTGTSMDGLSVALNSLFTPLSAFAFLTFTLLYTPCIATISAASKELHSFARALGMMAMQTGIAWLMGTIVYQLGTILL